MSILFATLTYEYYLETDEDARELFLDLTLAHWLGAASCLGAFRHLVYVFELVLGNHSWVETVTTYSVQVLGPNAPLTVGYMNASRVILLYRVCINSIITDHDITGVHMSTTHVVIHVVHHHLQPPMKELTMQQ